MGDMGERMLQLHLPGYWRLKGRPKRRFMDDVKDRKLVGMREERFKGYFGFVYSSHY